MTIRKEIIKYVEESIIPVYAGFDMAHQESHVKDVIRQSMEIASSQNVNLEMVYVVAAYHDLGLQFGRENHEKNSGKLLFEDEQLEKWFTLDQREVMKEAAEDHRASNKTAPRSIYGMIVAEADRLIDYETILVRTIQFGLKHYPELVKEEHFQRAYLHIEEKYGPNGYLKLWMETQKNRDGLNRIHEELKDKIKMKSDFDIIFEKYKE